MSRQISEEIIETLRHQADIVEIISEHVALRKKGQNYNGLCPFHIEKTPSFVVSPVKQIYHCFGCGKGGNVFSFLMDKEGLSFHETIEKLASRYGVILPERQLTQAQKQHEDHIKRLRQINEWAMLFFQNNLNQKEGNLAKEYLQARGLDQEVIAKFNLGYAPDQWESLYTHLNKLAVKDEEMLLLGLVQKSQRGNLIDKFRNRVIFPIFNDRGTTIGFGGRILGEGQPKYLNTQDTPLFQKGKHLYSLNLAKAEVRKLDQVIIMEGYMDVIAAHQNGINNVVASLGTALTQEQAKLITRYTYQTVICYDADAAGELAAMRGIEILREQGCKVKIIRIPEGKDPDDFLRDKGQKAFLQLINKAFSLFEYKFVKNMEKFDKDTMTGKISIIQDMLVELTKIKSPIARQGYITMLSETLSFPEAAIKEELRRHQSGLQTKAKGIPQLKQEERGCVKAQDTVLRLLLQDKSKIEEFEAAGGVELFENEEAQTLYLTLQALFQAGHLNISAEDLVALIEDEAQRQYLTGILLEEEIPGEEIKVFFDSLVTLKRHKVDKKIKGLMNQLAQLEKNGDASGASEIMLKISVLNKEKQTLRP